MPEALVICGRKMKAIQKLNQALDCFVLYHFSVFFFPRPGRVLRDIMEHTAILQKDTSTCKIQQASSKKPWKSCSQNSAHSIIYMEFYSINHHYSHAVQYHHSHLRVPTVILSQGVFKYQLQSFAVSIDPRCTISEALFPANLTLCFSCLSSNLGYMTSKALQFFCPFKTQHHFAVLELCCTLFLTPSSAACSVAEEGFISHSIIPTLIPFSGFHFLDVPIGHSAGFINQGGNLLKSLEQNLPL